MRVNAVAVGGFHHQHIRRFAFVRAGVHDASGREEAQVAGVQIRVHEAVQKDHATDAAHAGDDRVIEGA